jgi:luciferase family oxidoreductase group 1
VSDEAVTHFPEYVDNVLAMMEPDGVGLSVQGRTYPLKATPGARSVPTIWLLGSSDYSARLAAEKGMPYVFAHHFSGSGTAEALELYRSTFRPSPELAAPRTFLTVNVSVAETDEEAYRLALPQLQAMLTLRTGGDLKPQRLVEEAEKVELPPAQQDLVEAMAHRWVIGSAETARARIAELATTYGVDEVMVHPVGAAYTGTDPDRSPAREETLRLLAG